jgi:GDP-D-mannose 3',5'-epimerase
MTRSDGGRRSLVTGAGGFIGHHLVNALKARGSWVRGADLKHPQFGSSQADEFLLTDLRSQASCEQAAEGVDDIYALAADMGGIGYISSNHSSLSRNNILINANMLEAAIGEGTARYLFTSSACVYPSFRQSKDDATGLRESEAIPADPEKGYGWEKLFSEQLVSYYREDNGLDVRIARLHNVYGPLTAYDGGREKAPAAICRKVGQASDGSTVEIWGDGRQTRSFCFIDDCVEGLLRLMESGYQHPINIGTEELVTIDEMVDTVCKIAGKRLRKVHNVDKPQGVRGRNSDNTIMRSVLHWEPRISLELGLSRTYRWIWSELERNHRNEPPAPVVKSAEQVPYRLGS